MTLKLGCFHPVTCIRSGSGVTVRRNSISIVVYYFIQIIHYMRRSYDHLHAEIFIGNFKYVIKNQVEGFPSNTTQF
jgi:hypothetical protein